MHTYIHTHKNTLLRIHTYIHTYTHTYIHTNIHCCTYIHTYTHTRIQMLYRVWFVSMEGAEELLRLWGHAPKTKGTFIHTYIHTYIHTNAVQALSVWMAQRSFSGYGATHPKQRGLSCANGKVTSHQPLNQSRLRTRLRLHQGCHKVMQEINRHKEIQEISRHRHDTVIHRRLLKQPKVDMIITGHFDPIHRLCVDQITVISCRLLHSRTQ
jgi:hypothetical protein